MRKRIPEREEHEQFEAYGEYTYDYQGQPVRNKRREAEQAPAPSPAPTAAMKARARSRRRRHGFFKFAAVVAALLVLLIVTYETAFRLEVVYVMGNETKTPQQVVLSSGLVRGRNLLTIDESDVAEAMESDHTVIFKGMQKDYPSTIYLYIEERKTVAAMQWLGILYTLDAEGMVMDEKNSSQLPDNIPVVTGFRVSNINVGQQLMLKSAKQLEAYRAIMQELELQLYADQVSEINLGDPSNIYLVTAEGITVRLGDASYMQAKIGAVRTDMAYLRQLSKTSGMLDVTTPEDAKYIPEN